MVQLRPQAMMMVVLVSGFETVTTTAELQQRRVSFLPVGEENGWPWTICVEHLEPG